MKRCSKCKQEKPLTEFGPNKQYSQGVRPECRECTQAYSRAYHQAHRNLHLARARENYQKNRERRKVDFQAYRQKNADKIHAAHLRRKYGISKDQYRTLMTEQEGRCAICRRSFMDIHRVRLHVDHDHATGQVRGLLCNRCNLLLGMVQDIPALLMQAVNYLTR